MKYLILLTTVLYLSSCTPQYKSYKCAPSRGSKDWAKRQWMKERSDGYWIVTTVRMKDRSDKLFECKPTQQQLDSL